MDPTACLRRIIEAIEAKDREEALQAIQDLSQWLGRGGFMPTIRRGDFEAILSAMSDLLGRNLD